MLYATVILAAVLAAVVIELASRWRIRRTKAYYVRRPFERIHMTLDRTAFPDLAAVSRVEINAEGERGDPLPINRDGLYRVLVAGGSAAECGLLDQSATWPAVLQDELRSGRRLKALGARRVHVGNIGRSMMTAEAVFTMLECTLPRYEKLDLLILMVGLSDVVDWLEKGAPATIPGGAVDLDGIFAVYPGAKFRWSIRGSAATRIGLQALRRFVGKTYYRKNAGSRYVELRRRRRQAARWIDNAPDPAPMLAHFEKYLCRIVSLAEAKGARVVFARQPWSHREPAAAKQRLMWNFCASPIVFEKPGPPAAYYTAAASDALLLTCDRHWAALAASLGITQVDLCAAVPAGDRNFYDELHFTAAGALLAAQAIAAAIIEPKINAEIEHDVRQTGLVSAGCAT